MSVELTKLPSGLRIITDRMEGLETAAIAVHVGVGSRHESEREHGLSHLLEHMAFKGTRRRSARSITQRSSMKRARGSSTCRSPRTLRRRRRAIRAATSA